MQKDQIFNDRKELKKHAHKVVRGHYFVLVFLMLLLILFGNEFKLALVGLGGNKTALSSKGADVMDAGTVFSGPAPVSIAEVAADFVAGKIGIGGTGIGQFLKDFLNSADSSETLGRTNGVLASVVNTFASGSLFSGLAQTLQSVLHSDGAAVIIAILLSFLWYLLIFTFLKNVYSAVIRRLYLQADVYESIHVKDIAFFAEVHKWWRASWAMLVTYFYTILWSLTIVGGFIKMYSYWAVPYIVAENPAIRAKEAVTLSRKMMNGHKLELFKLQVTFAGWFLLGLVTLGISDLAYGASYRLACYTSFYSKVREQAKQEKLEGVNLLNDPYLFRKADRIKLYETYFEVVDQITLLHEKDKIELTGWRKKVADWFGIWMGSLRKKAEYDRQEERVFALSRYKLCMTGQAYPFWLNRLWTKKSVEKEGYYSALRCYTVWSLFLQFIILCFVGWAWEVILHLMQTGEFANRGTMYGPWLPIYGCGGIIVLILCSRFRKKPVVEFFSAVVLCGSLEYFAAWHLEQKYHMKWWSYEGYFLNLDGRICAEGLLVFGVGCCTVVYYLAPTLDHLIMKIKHSVLIGICITLAAAYMTDLAYSLQHPNMSEGAVEKTPAAEGETEAISEAAAEPGAPDDTGQTEDDTGPPA